MLKMISLPEGNLKIFVPEGKMPEFRKFCESRDRDFHIIWQNLPVFEETGLESFSPDDKKMVILGYKCEGRWTETWFYAGNPAVELLKQGFVIFKMIDFQT